MNAGDVKVRLIADLKQFSSNITKASGAVKEFAAASSASLKKASSVFGGFSKSVGAGIASAGKALLHFSGNIMRNLARDVSHYAKIAGLAIAGIGVYAVKLASTLEQTQSRFRIVFGDMAAEAEQWNNAFADALRLNRSDIQGYMATFQKMAESMGFGRKAALDITKTLVQMTADMAAFEDLKLDDAFEKITSALVGMPRPLQSLGYDLRETAVQEEAVRIGLIKTGEQMTEQQKVIARLSQMTRVMSKANQNAKKTMDETQMAFGASWAQIRATLESIGTGMLPLVGKAAIAIRDWLFEHQQMFMRWGENLGAALKMAADVFMGVVDIFRRAPSEGFDVLLNSMIAVIKAAGKIAVDMALRIGKGIWAGVKEGIFGEDLPGLEERTRQLYESRLKMQANPPEPYQQGFKTVGFGAVPTQEPRFPKEYQEAQRAAAGQLRSEKTNSLFAGLDESIKNTTVEALNDIKNSNADLSKGVDESLQQWKKRLDEIREKYGEVNGAANNAKDSAAAAQGETDGAVEGAKETTVSANDAIMASTEELQQRIEAITQAWREAGGAAGEQSEDAARVVQDYITRLQEEVHVLSLVASGHDTEADRLKLVNEFKRQGITLTDEQISKIEELIAAQEKLSNKIEHQEAPTKWQTMWENAAAGIDAAMEDAFVSVTKNVHSATEAIENMLSAIQEAITRSVFQQYMQPGINEFIGKFVGEGFGSSVEQSPTTQTGTKVSGQAVGKARGGIVPGFSLGGLVEGFKRGGLVYAQSGMFTPRGTDTVPAMLTPGEGVLDQDTTARLRKILQVPEPSPAASRPVVMNINAIDAAGTYQFLIKNQRAIASMLGNTQQHNHPTRRG